MNPSNTKNPSNPFVLMLLTNAFDPDPRIYQEARALVANGYHVTILCWDRDHKRPPKENKDGIEIERVYVRSTHGRGSTQVLFLFLFWIKALIRAWSKRFDVIHCHDFDTLPLGYVLSRFKTSRLIYDAHESYVDMLVNVPAWMKKIIYTMENILLRRADLVMTVGEILRASLVRRGARNTCVVGNWKNPNTFKFADEPIQKERERLGIVDGQLVVSFIANLGPERQLPQLIEAVKEMPSVFLLIGGDGSGRDIVEDASRVYANIFYLGYVDPFKVPLYTALSDVIFYGFDPSNPNAQYSAPNKLFEALAAGKPVMTAEFGEIGLIVKEQGCGILLSDYAPTNIKEALTKFLDASYYRKLRESSVNASQLYSWKMAEDVLLESYKMAVRT